MIKNHSVMTIKTIKENVILYNMIQETCRKKLILPIYSTIVHKYDIHWISEFLISAANGNAFINVLYKAITDVLRKKIQVQKNTDLNLIRN